jgi:hypothetical protein
MQYLADDRFVKTRLNELRGPRALSLMQSAHPALLAGLASIGVLDSLALGTGAGLAPGATPSPTTDAAIDLAQLAYAGGPAAAGGMTPSKFRGNPDLHLALAGTPGPGMLGYYGGMAVGIGVGAGGGVGGGGGGHSAAAAGGGGGGGGGIDLTVSPPGTGLPASHLHLYGASPGMPTSSPAPAGSLVLPGPAAHHNGSGAGAGAGPNDAVRQSARAALFTGTSSPGKGKGARDSGIASRGRARSHAWGWSWWAEPAWQDHGRTVRRAGATAPRGAAPSGGR